MFEKLLNNRYFIAGYPLELIAWCILFVILFGVIVWLMAKGRKR